VRAPHACSGVLAIGALAIGAGDAIAAPTPATTKGCYAAKTAYPFPFPGGNSRRLAYAQPNCREASHGSQDATVTSGLTAYEHATQNVLPGFADTDDNRFFKLLLQPNNPGDPDIAPRTWPLVDSLGQTFAYLEQVRTYDADGNPVDWWAVYLADGSLLGFVASPRTQLLVQGRACMLPNSLESQYAMVVLFGADFGWGPHAFGTQPDPGPVYMGVRGFIPRAALPPTGLGNPGTAYADDSTDQIIDAFQTGCTQRDLGLKRSPITERPYSGMSPVYNSGTLLLNITPWEVTYQGQKVDGQREQEIIDGPHTVTPGNRYANYNGFPDPHEYQFIYGDVPQPPTATPRPDIVDEVMVTANTTGVAGGGIVRAIVPTQTPFREVDHFPYRDPNVTCTKIAGKPLRSVHWGVQWAMVALEGDATGIDGWVPIHTGPTTRRCSAAQVGRPWKGGEPKACRGEHAAASCIAPGTTFQPPGVKLPS
jgi:hypothetical protein